MSESDPGLSARSPGVGRERPNVLQSLSPRMRWEQREYLKTPSANGNARVHPEIEIRRLPRRQRPSTPLRGLCRGYRLRLQDRSSIREAASAGPIPLPTPALEGRKSHSPHASERSVSGCFGRLQANVHASRVTCPKMQRLRHRKILLDPPTILVGGQDVCRATCAGTRWPKWARTPGTPGRKGW